MATINKCPVCGKNDRVNEVNFYIDGDKYFGLMCSKCKQILYSEKVKEITLKKDYDRFVNYP